MQIVGIGRRRAIDALFVDTTSKQNPLFISNPNRCAIDCKCASVYKSKKSLLVNKDIAHERIDAQKFANVVYLYHELNLDPFPLISQTIAPLSQEHLPRRKKAPTVLFIVIRLLRHVPGSIVNDNSFERALLKRQALLRAYVVMPLLLCTRQACLAENITMLQRHVIPL